MIVVGYKVYVFVCGDTERVHAKIVLLEDG